MNEKIQIKLETMKVWAKLSENAEQMIAGQNEEIGWAQESIDNEMEKPEEERQKWLIESRQTEITEHQRKIKAIEQVQAQILKIMG